jgi:hypothetical protein
MWSWLSAGHLFRLPAWAAVMAVAFVLGAVVVPMAASAGPVSGSSRSDPPPGVPPLKHVFVIMMENMPYDDLLFPSNPNTTFIQQLAANNGLATDYFGVTHVSLPNYIAATSGQTWGSNSDDVAQAPLFNHENLVDQLEAAGVSWKAYMENLPSPGDLVSATPDGLYVRKHDPFLMYPDVYQNPARAVGGLSRGWGIWPGMWLQVGDSWRHRDRSVALALSERHDKMNELHASLIAELASGRMTLPVTMEMTLVARFYERLGDHAVNLARRVIYLVGSAPG